MTSIAVIVCGHTLDRWDDIQLALDSVLAQTRSADHLIFSVDNNDDLFAAAQDAFGGITVVHNTGTRGVSGARNAAARATDADVLAYLDDDAVADPNWVEQLIGWYADDSVIGVGGHAEPAWDGTSPSWFPASFNWVVGCSHSGIADTPAPVRNFIGCNMSIRRSAWATVGGFDESIGRVGADGGGGDETDFCIRVTEAIDGTIMNDPSAMVLHRVPASRQTWGYFLKRCRSEGRSKAQIAAQAGADLALADERRHLLGELPRSFGAGIADTARGDLSGLGRSAAIILGTAATGVGYLGGILRLRRAGTERPSVDFSSTKVLTADLDEPSADLDSFAGERALLVARRGNSLLGIERFDELPEPAALRDYLTSTFTESVNSTNLAGGGLASAGTNEQSAAVVIATKDRTDSLRRCLQSITQLTHLPDQIIVVDNAPTTDETKLMIAEWNATSDLSVDYVRCDRAGLARAHNAALPFLNTDVVAITDDDVIVDRYWLERLLVGFALNDNIACVTGAILPAELETWPQEWVESTSNYTKGFANKRFSLAAPPDDPLFPFTAGSMGSGANMAFATSWLLDNGGFDEALGIGTTALGGDDLRAFYDVVTSHRELLFTPHAIVFHHHHRTEGAIERLSYGYGAGLSAYLASVVFDQPSAAIAMLRRAPRAVRHAAQVTATPDASTFPGDRHRTRRQRLGMLSGPFRYVRSRA